MFRAEDIVSRRDAVFSADLCPRSVTPTECVFPKTSGDSRTHDSHLVRDLTQTV
jgi:hypothetical protein